MKNQYVVMLLLLSLQLAFSCQPEKAMSEKEKFTKLNLGDSIFCASGKYDNIVLGKIERVPIVSREELQRLNYTRKDTLGFVSDQFEVRNQEEFFYKHGSSFIGICVGKDSIQTENDGKYFLKVEPSQLLLELMKGKPLLNLNENEKIYVFKAKDIFLENQFTGLEKK